MTLSAFNPFSKRRIGLRPPTIARPVLVVAALMVVGIVAVTAQQLLQARWHVLSNADRQISQLDAIFAEQASREIRVVDVALRGAVEARREGQASLDIEAALHRRVARVQQDLETGIIDADGLQPAHGDDLPKPAPAAVRRLLATPRYDTGGSPSAQPVTVTVTVNDLRISAPFRSPDGAWRAYAVRLLFDARGKPDGAVYAALNLASLAPSPHFVDLTQDAAVLLLHRDGTVLMRVPALDSAIGQTYPNQAALHDALAADGVTVRTLTRGRDHSLRLVALTPTPDYPIVVTVSLSRREVLATWHRSAVVFTLVAFAACAAITLLMLVLITRSRQFNAIFQDLRGAKDVADGAYRELRRQMVEREHAESALRDAQRAEAIGQLTRGVAHDFNNLLAVVLGNIDLMALSHRDDPAALKRLDTMRVAAERGAMLTGQLMAFARRQPLQPRAVNLNEVASSMHPLLVSAVGSRIRVELELAEGLPPAKVDPTQIELAILNLAINARDAMTTGGVLTIFTAATRLTPTGTDAAADGVALGVRDTGPGMSAEVRAKAFEPFFTTKGPGKGSGLGLSQVHGLAYQSGGNVELISAPGEGTCVEIRLPIAPGKAAAPAAPKAPILASLPHAGRVLLVDDDDAVRETASAVLRAQGYTVTEAQDATRALTMLRRGDSFDVLVTDVVMPGMSGPELIREVLRFAPDLPTVLISGYTEPGELVSSGMPSFFVRKPFTPDTLKRTIEAAISARQSAGPSGTEPPETDADDEADDEADTIEDPIAGLSSAAAAG